MNKAYTSADEFLTNKTPKIELLESRGDSLCPINDYRMINDLTINSDDFTATLYLSASLHDYCDYFSDGLSAMDFILQRNGYAKSEREYGFYIQISTDDNMVLIQNCSVIGQAYSVIKQQAIITLEFGGIHRS